MASAFPVGERPEQDLRMDCVLVYEDRGSASDLGMGDELVTNDSY